jgi:hypothetical protein
LKARETEDNPLVELTPMALEVDCHELINGVGRGNVWTLTRYQAAEHKSV